MENLDQSYLNDLVLKAQQGSSNAFAELYAATYQRLFAYSYRYLRDEHLAQDALQETFIRVLKGIGKLQNPSLFIAWLNQISFHVCFDMQKEQSRHGDQTGNEIMETIPSRTGIPEDVVEIDYKRYVMQQIEKLPVEESQVVIMKYYQDLTLDEIGEMLNISRSTVKRYLKSARKHLENLAV